jgi:hypothetical protein
VVAVVSCGKVSPKGNIEKKDVDVPEFVNLDLKVNSVYFMPEGQKLCGNRNLSECCQ